MTPTRIKALEALRRYATHKKSCPVWSVTYPRTGTEPVCTCGYGELVEKLDALTEQPAKAEQQGERCDVCDGDGLKPGFGVDDDFHDCIKCKGTGQAPAAKSETYPAQDHDCQGIKAHIAKTCICYADPAPQRDWLTAADVTASRQTAIDMDQTRMMKQDPKRVVKLCDMALAALELTHKDKGVGR